MNGLVTYFYPKPIGDKTFEPLIFYFEKTSVVGGFHFVNELLHIRTSAIVNSTVAKSNEQICEEIQRQLEEIFIVYKTCPKDAPPEIARYFNQLPEKPRTHIRTSTTF